MKNIRLFIFASVLGMFLPSAYAADEAANVDNEVVGACMIQKFSSYRPVIERSTIEKCADGEPVSYPSCLGLKEDEYKKMAVDCVAQLAVDKCTSAKMKVSLIQYENCVYEKDANACFQKLGFSADQLSKLKADCKS